MRKKLPTDVLHPLHPVPVGLEPIKDDEEAMVAWSKLGDRQKLFFAEWFRTGFNTTLAYQKAYRLKDERTARTRGMYLLRNNNIKTLRKVMYESIQEEVILERVLYVELAALEDDDARVRLQAAKQIRMRIEKINPSKKSNGDTNNQFNILNMGDISPLLDIINGGERYKNDVDIPIPAGQVEGDTESGGAGPAS